MSAFMVSKKHIDILIQSALVGVTDLNSWHTPGDQHFDWYHDDSTHRLDQFAEVGDEKPPAIPGYNSIELVPPSVLGQRLVNECARSVNYRYEDHEEEDLGTAAFPYVFETVTDGTMTIGARGLVQTVAPLVTGVQLAKGHPLLRVSVV
jgi:hypothetical protein